MNAEDIAVGLVALNGGELVGRTRAQKVAYLLDRCGADFGLRFTYHHYGPYCFDLANGLDAARAEGRIGHEEKLSARHGVPYSIFTSTGGEGDPTGLGGLPAAETRKLLRRMKNESNFVLELAATVVFLRDRWHYYGKDKVAATDATGAAVEETKRRKSLKATPERLDKALALLRELGLAEAPAPAGSR